MKYLKTFEQNSNEPEPGDYVICEDSGTFTGELDEFIKNHVGQFIQMDAVGDFYIIRYENIPNYLKGGFYYNDCTIMERHEIKHWSKNKEDLEIILSLNKYNL